MKEREEERKEGRKEEKERKKERKRKKEKKRKEKKDTTVTSRSPAHPWQPKPSPNHFLLKLMEGF